MADREMLVRTIPVYELLVFSEDGTAVIGPSAFRQDDLAGKGRKSVSTLREEVTGEGETARRSMGLTVDQQWKADPVVARATAGSLRSVYNDVGERELCVNADPTTSENDRLGPCPTHASVLRAISNQTKVPPRLSWDTLRANLAARFADVRHLSGKPPRLRS